MKRITLLGSTGSVGMNTLRVVREHPSLFKVVALAAGKNSKALKEQIEEFGPISVYLKDDEETRALSKEFGKRIRFFSENEGLRAFSSSVDADILVAATSGTSALLPVMDALTQGKRVALANKEILVVAGALVISKLRQNPSASLIPVDSEHSAIFQCLQKSRREDAEKLILTSSGGPLRELPEDKFTSIPKEKVINHPKWRMGKKISVDSATLMNKGLEIIEASWLFGFPIGNIEVLIHPEAVVHSGVEFIDGAILAQLGVTDMRLPIQYALSYPSRLPSPPEMKLNLAELSELHFSKPNRKKFPCLDIAYEAARQSGSAPCVLSAADEAAVEAYLEDQIRFTEIPKLIEKVLSRHRHVENPDIHEIQSIHSWALEETKKLCQAP